MELLELPAMVTTPSPSPNERGTLSCKPLSASLRGAERNGGLRPLHTDASRSSKLLGGKNPEETNG